MVDLPSTHRLILSHRSTFSHDSLLSLLCFHRRLSGIRSLEDLVQFLQSETFRLDKEEVHEYDFKTVPSHEEDIKPVANLF